MSRISLFLLPFYLIFANTAWAERWPIDTEFHHLRNAEPREWSHYAEKAEDKKWSISFDVETPSKWKLLTFRQKGVKQVWAVQLNGQKLGTLQRDHNHLEHGFEIPDSLLKAKANLLEVATTSDTPDDIELGDVALCDSVFPLADPARKAELAKTRGFQRAVPGDLGARVSLTCRERKSGQPIPCRFTIIDSETGALAFVGAESTNHTAVREGVVYTLNGTATVHLDATRKYRIFCGRGFEYSLAQKEIILEDGEEIDFEFLIEREVATPGLVACDTHLHSYEFDRHGDCTLVERIISTAGEGVELPVSTAHDKHIDFAEITKQIGADKWLTPILGCEVTTNLGHFNSFPIQAGAPPAQHKLRDWEQIFHNIYQTPQVKVCILNHGRDIHRGFTPLAPENFDLDSGTFREGRVFRANGIEIINSGATQTDPMQLVRDWFSLLRSGHKVAAVGSSDSHTVNFAIAGQGRTYLELPDDSDSGNLDQAAAVQSFVDGNTYVSFGLLAFLDIDESNDQVSVRVTGPSWTTADRVRLFHNGLPIRDEEISPSQGAIEKFEKTYKLSDLKGKPGDFLCVVATGPGILDPWWPMMPPYQPDSPIFEPYVFGMSPARWVEGE